MRDDHFVMPDRDRDPESAAARRPARYGVPAPLLKLLERCAGIMTVTLECGQPVVDLFIDRLFLKCSIRAKSISVSPMSKRCCTNARGRSAGEADSSVSYLSAGRRNLGLESARAHVHGALQYDCYGLGRPAIFRGSQR